MKLSNQIKRLTLIIELLRRETYPTKQEIIDFIEHRMADDIYDVNIENTGTSPRNLDRDIKALKENGFAIEYSKAKRGYYFEEVTQEGEVFNRMLEVFHISNASMYGDYLQLEKVSMNGYQHLSGFMHAIQNSKQVELIYQKFYTEGPAKRKIAPYLVKEFKRRLYVLGLDIEKNALRTFAFDRIQSIHILRESFQHPGNLSDFYTDCYGIVSGGNEKVEKVVLKAYNTKVNYLQTLPLHHSQKLVKKGDGFGVFELKLKPTFDFIMEILSHSHEIQVLEPQSLIDEVKWRLKDALDFYN